MKSESKARRSNVDPIAGRVMGGMNQRMRTVSRPGTAAAQCERGHGRLAARMRVEQATDAGRVQARKHESSKKTEVVHYKERKLCVAV